jgi:hypothetical protein
VAKNNLKVNQDAIRAILNDPAVGRDLVRRAENVAAAAGGEDSGYMVTDLVLEESRAAVSVMATGKAHFHNRKHHSLLRGLDAGRR